jgi:hypothetical protein
MLLNRASRPLASPKPAARPKALAAAPIISASAMTVRSTCRRDAPASRSSPNSRERWATVIDSELKIVNAPTSSATPPNASSTPLMIEMNCFSPSSVKRSFLAAVCIRACGSAVARLWRTCAADTPSRAVTRIESTRPASSNRPCAVCRSNTAIVAVPSDSTEPNVVRPVMRKLRAGPLVAMRTLSPTCRCCLSAVPASRTTWPGPLAQAPSFSLNGVSLPPLAAAAGSRPTPNHGPSPATLPSSPTIRA